MPIEKSTNNNNKIPMIFKFPIDEQTFIDKNLPGNYKELSKKYKPNDVVKEIESCYKNVLGVLKGIDTEENCYIVPVDQINNTLPEVIKVYFLE